MSIEETLKKVPFFSQLNEAQLKNLASMGKALSLQANVHAFHEGDAAECMYIIMAGSIRIYKSTRNIDSEVIVLHEGEVFGELALLDSHPRSASALALTDCELLTIDQFAFMSLILKSRAQVTFRVFSALVQRIRETNERYVGKEIALLSLSDKMEIERLRSLQQLVAGVAHELNTPLGIIATAVSIIQTTLNSDEFKAFAQDRHTSSMLEDSHEALELIQRNIQRAHRLTQDFKKVSVSQLTDVKEQFHLIDAIKEILNLFSINARKAKIEVQVINQIDEQTGEQDGSQNDIWTGYRGYLSQILLNLLGNVERYAYPDGKGGKVEITVATMTEVAGESPRFILTFRDFGAGISAENLPRVFEPFFTTGRIKGGTGLGLSIVHNIVTSALKGNITASSTPGDGTLFRITFPKEIAD
jgi:signal transduction histidine kinase